jgi:hypothetical protein
VNRRVSFRTLLLVQYEHDCLCVRIMRPTGGHFGSSLSPSRIFSFPPWSLPCFALRRQAGGVRGSEVAACLVLSCSYEKPGLDVIRLLRFLTRSVLGVRGARVVSQGKGGRVPYEAGTRITGPNLLKLSERLSFGIATVFM